MRDDISKLFTLINNKLKTKHSLLKRFELLQRECFSYLLSSDYENFEEKSKSISNITANIDIIDYDVYNKENELKKSLGIDSLTSFAKKQDEDLCNQYFHNIKAIKEILKYLSLQNDKIENYISNNQKKLNKEINEIAEIIKIKSQMDIPSSD